MTLLQVAFCYLATITVAAAAIAVTRRNPVHSVLWMLLVFIHVAILYVFLNADFIAAVQIIVYADEEHTYGLVVNRIVDIVETNLRIQSTYEVDDNLLGTAVVQDRVTDVLNMKTMARHAARACRPEPILK